MIHWFEFLLWSQSFCHVGPWYQLEKLTRRYAVKYGTIHVISGVIFDEDNNGKKDGDEVEKKLVNLQYNRDNYYNYTTWLRWVGDSSNIFIFY